MSTTNGVTWKINNQASAALKQMRRDTVQLHDSFQAGAAKAIHFAAQTKKMGSAFDEVEDKVRDARNKMVEFGFTQEQVVAGLGLMVRHSRETGEAMSITALRLEELAMETRDAGLTQMFWAKAVRASKEGILRQEDAVALVVDRYKEGAKWTINWAQAQELARVQHISLTQAVQQLDDRVRSNKSTIIDFALAEKIAAREGISMADAIKKVDNAAAGAGGSLSGLSTRGKAMGAALDNVADPATRARLELKLLNQEVNRTPGLMDKAQTKMQVFEVQLASLGPAGQLIKGGMLAAAGAVGALGAAMVKFTKDSIQAYIKSSGTAKHQTDQLKEAYKRLQEEVGETAYKVTGAGQKIDLTAVRMKQASAALDNYNNTLAHNTSGQERQLSVLSRLQIPLVSQVETWGRLNLQAVSWATNGEVGAENGRTLAEAFDSSYTASNVLLGGLGPLGVGIAGVTEATYELIAASDEALGVNKALAEHIRKNNKRALEGMVMSALKATGALQTLGGGLASVGTWMRGVTKDARATSAAIAGLIKQQEQAHTQAKAAYMLDQMTHGPRLKDGSLVPKPSSGGGGGGGGKRELNAKEIKLLQEARAGVMGVWSDGVEMAMSAPYRGMTDADLLDTIKAESLLKQRNAEAIAKMEAEMSSKFSGILGAGYDLADAHKKAPVQEQIEDELGIDGTSSEAITKMEAASKSLDASFTSLLNGGISGVTQGMAGMIESMAAGEMKAGDLGKAFMGMLGQLFTQTGTGMLLMGLSLATIEGGAPNPAALIGYGAGLTIVGAAMSGLAKRRSGGSGSTAAAVQSGFSSASDRMAADKDRDKELNVMLAVEGFGELVTKVVNRGRESRAIPELAA